MISARVVETPKGAEDMAGRTVSCQTNDYSLGGINISVTRELPVDTTVLVSVFLQSPAHAIHDIPARVAWTRRTDDTPPVMLGIEFGDMTTEQATDWKALVRASLFRA